MKFSKTDNTRVYVSRYKQAEERGDLYKSPKSKNEGKEALEKQITARINEANKLYDVFFAADNFRDLEGHFKEIVGKVRESDGANVKNTLSSYTGFNYIVKGNKKFKKVEFFSNPVSGGKNLKSAMRLHVRERMEKNWQSESYKNAAVEVLLCICDGKNYQDSISRLSDDVLSNFYDACSKCQTGKNGQPGVYIKQTIPGIENVPSRINTLEGYFSSLMQAMARQCSQDISLWQQGDEQKRDPILEKGIQWLEECKCLTVKGKNKGDKAKVYLEKIHYKWATTERLEAVLVRMRRPLKRGSNGEIAIALLQGLAQVNGTSLAAVIRDMRSDTEQYKKLKKFVDSVIRNYYHTDALKSIKRTDVKVQPKRQSDEDILLALSNEGKPQKAALNETLMAYAASKEKSDEILLDLRKLLFKYFSVEDKFPEKIWAIPSIPEEFFDDSFEEDENRKGDRDAGYPLSELWGKDKPHIAEIKNRIKYVNYGIYLRCLDEANNEFEKYWLKFIKEYVEKNYTGSRKISREGCFSTNMLASCWRDMIRFLCGKYIDLGKAVCHFAMPENLPQTGDVSCGQIRDEFKAGISSFDYEAIKAEETLQRDISVITVAAVSSFSASIIDEEKREEYIKKEKEKERKKQKNLEDIMFIDAPLETASWDPEEPVLWNMTKADAKNQLLRFYGGYSSFEGKIWKDEKSDREFICEMLSHLKKIRNENFHYTSGKDVAVKTEYTKLLWEKEQEAFADQVRGRYYTNNTGVFYKEDDLCQLVKNLYEKQETAESQIPAFRNIWKRKDLSSEISKALSGGGGNAFSKEVKEDSGKQEIFGNALYFLLKEIYYQDFILNREVKKSFFDAANEYFAKNKDDKKNGRAVQNFNDYVKRLKENEENLTFGGLCQKIVQEYNQQNTKKGEGEIYKHYKMLFPIYVKNAFKKFVEEKYGFLKNPIYREISGEAHFLDETPVPCMAFPEEDKQIVVWYTLAHFIHPRQLSLLVGDFKSYIQYRQDIARRMDCAQEIRDKDALIKEVEAKTQFAQSVLGVLEFVRVTSGRISNVFTDYYTDENAYADYLSQYVNFDKQGSTDSFSALKSFCENALPGDELLDIYADKTNPKVLRNVELARMYGGGDLPLEGRTPVSVEEIRAYYTAKPKVEKFLNQGLCKDKKEQEAVVKQQKAKGRITLNDVTDIYTIVNDLLGKLISLAYLRERDQMYLFFGFYYMAMQSACGWEGEELQSVAFKNCNIKQGLVLYQLAGIYDYGIEMPYYSNKKEKWRWMGGGKYTGFSGMHEESMNCALRLFGKKNQLDSALTLRAYIDHGKYYVDHNKSLVGLYNEVYNLFFGYSQKLRNSVAYNFKSGLERHFVEAKLRYKKGTTGFELEKLDSIMFTYKLQGKTTCNLKAKDESFIKELKAVLEYSKKMTLGGLDV